MSNLSVCLSVALYYCVETAKHIVTRFRHPLMLVFSAYSDTETQ